MNSKTWKNYVRTIRSRDENDKNWSNGVYRNNRLQLILRKSWKNASQLLSIRSRKRKHSDRVSWSVRIRESSPSLLRAQCIVKYKCRGKGIRSVVPVRMLARVVDGSLYLLIIRTERGVDPTSSLVSILVLGDPALMWWFSLRIFWISSWKR